MLNNFESNDGVTDSNAVALIAANSVQQAVKPAVPASRNGIKKKIGGFKIAGLEINIEAVNEKYFGVGGETALKQMENSDMVALEKEISELASVCVQYMKGDLIYTE